MNAPSITATDQTQAVTRNFDLSAALKDAFTASRAYTKATPSAHQATEPVGATPSAFQHVSRFAIPFFLGIALAFPLLIYLIQGGLNESRYWVDLGILILTYVMLG